MIDNIQIIIVITQTLFTMDNTIDIKLSLIGDKCVGKTSFISILASDVFQCKNNYHNFYYQVNGGIIYNFKFTSVEDADYILLMFDLSNIDSQNYINEFLQKNTDTQKNKEIILIGNKFDLIKYISENERSSHPVYSCIHKHLFSDNNVSKYYDVSALSFYNYTKPFDYIIKLYNSKGI